MRRVRYSVAASLDAYIATPDGGFDWIVMDPEIDFAAMYASVGALLMGRGSWDVTVKMGGTGGPDLPTYVYSRTLPEGVRDGVTFVHDAVPHVRALKETDGKTLWLWGGGQLFRELATAGLVDEVEVAIIPILLGQGLPLLPSPGPQLSLRLRAQRTYQSSGIVLLTYDVAG
jgi:dihydrofolate reductase